MRILAPASRARLPGLVPSLGLILGFACVPAVLAQSLPFTGRWLLDDRSAAQAAYPILSIEDGSMTWSGPGKPAAKCVQEFVLKKEKPGTVYTDGRGTRFVAGAPGSLPTYLLTVGACTCGGIGGDVRISYPLVYDVGHIDVIEYVNGKPVSSRRFRRQK